MSNISKETVHRLVRDIREIIKNPLDDNGIYYKHDETDMLKGYALIIGPSDTPYFGGNYFFEFNFPTDYPYSPPTLQYLTNDGIIRFNPNLYKTGKVCISILNTWRGEPWSSCQTIRSVLLTLCTLLNRQPLLNEPGVQKTHVDFLKYNDAITFSNISFSICNMILKKSIPTHFEVFYDVMVENFLKNYDSIIDFVTEKQKEDSTTTIVVGFYNFSVSANYKTVLAKLIKCKQEVEEYQESNANQESNPNQESK